MSHDSDAQHRGLAPRAWTALLCATLALATQLPASVAASPSSHAEIRGRVDRVIFSGRGNVVRRTEVVATASRRADSLPAHDPDDARATHRREASDRAVVEQAGKSPKDLQRLPDSSIVIVKPAVRQSLRPAAFLASIADRRRAARETVFHDAHAPPRHA